MKYSIVQFLDIWAQYVANAPTVIDAFQFVQSGYTEKDFNALRVYLNTLAEKYPGIAYEICYSTTASTGQKKKVIERTGHVGRPKTKVVGEKINPHIHGILISIVIGADLDSACGDVGKYLTKKERKSPDIKQQKTSKVVPIDREKQLSDAVGCLCRYEHSQADSIRRGGEEYDWKYFDDERFYIPTNEPTVSRR